ncbi:MAG: hypothetical protein V4662_25360 [Verrucomicrobiota bacterium]
MAVRSRRRSRQIPRWLLLLLGLGGVMIVLVLMAPMLVMNWVRSYVQKEVFRGKMEQFLGTQMKGSVTLGPLRWTGDEVTTSMLEATTVTGWKAEVSGLHVGLDWQAFRNRQWRIVETSADTLELSFKAPEVGLPGVVVPPPTEPVLTSETQSSSIPEWIRAYLPNTTEIDGVRFDALSLTYPGGWRLGESKLRVAAWQQGEQSVQATVEGGILETPVQLPVQLHPMKFNLSRASARLSREDLHLTSATLSWIGDSEITARGHVRPQDKTWELNTHLSAIPLREVLSQDWKLRLTGLVEGDLNITGGQGKDPKVEGDVQLKNAVLTALPVLDKLASYTRVDRFKRLVLDIATAHVIGSGESRQFEKIVLQSNGLLRIEGNLAILSGKIDGSFMIGVTPETLRWIPGAQQHVFTSTNPTAPAGMLWTPLHISGTIDAPREDLTERLMGGAGKALLNAPAEVVGRAGEALLSPVVGEDLAKKPGEVLKGATKTLTSPGDAAKKASEAAEKGIDLLKGLGGGLLGK